jgi:uncharacterized protein
VNRARRVGVISDTHMPPFDDVVCSAIETAFAGVDLILHAGDLVTLAVLDWLEAIAPVRAARGNNDTYLPTDPRLADVQVLDLDGTRIGVAHVLPQTDDVDPAPAVWVFGDSHRDVVERRGGVLFVNPGSPTSPHLRVDRPGTVAVLTVGDGPPAAEIVHLPVPGHPGSRPLRPASGRAVR